MICKISKGVKKITSISICICAMTAILYSCANMASPSGGDYDFDPPVVVKVTPSPNQINVKSGKIEVIFDELVQLDKPLEKVIITPPQKNFPVIRAQSNKVIVELKDTLQSNTTYTIDFTDAIKDNNEGNILENFAISFSTGQSVDSLQMSGKVLDAMNLEPVSGIYVGIHSDLSDSAFTQKPFVRISRTNDQGVFTIKGIAAGRYKIYALNDLNRDYKYDNLGEAIAFLDTIISPYSEKATRYDSIFSPISAKIKELQLDSLLEVEYTRFLPEDIILRSFTSPFKRQYLQKSERTSDDSFSFFFGAPTELPRIGLLDSQIHLNNSTILERNITNDTLKYWITDKNITNQDTLRIKISYIETDTLNQPQIKTDTLNLINRTKSKREKENKNTKKKEDKVDLLSVKTNIGQTVDIYQKIYIEFDTPTRDFSSDKIVLKHMIDSVYTDLNYLLIKDTLNPRKFNIHYDWIPGESYTLSIDSATILGYNGLANEKLDLTFKVKKLDEYGNLFINIYSLADSMPAFVELLDKTDKPIRKAQVMDGGALFMNLTPGTYYARIILDANGNGKWDAGDYDKKIEPEKVYYYNKSFNIKPNWDIEEDWDILAIPISKQKPLEITQNKPKSDEAKRKLMERRDAQMQKKNNQQKNNQSNKLNNQTRSSNF